MKCVESFALYPAEFLRVGKSNFCPVSGLHYDNQPSSRRWQIAYSNFGCYNMGNYQRTHIQMHIRTFTHNIIIICTYKQNYIHNYTCMHTLHTHATIAFSTTITLLPAAKCGDLPNQTLDQEEVVGSVSAIGRYSNLTIEGATVDFLCPPGWVLIGSNSSTCMGNGEWEPNPMARTVRCIRKTSNISSNVKSGDLNDNIMLHKFYSHTYCRKIKFWQRWKNCSSFNDHIFSDFNSFLSDRIPMWTLLTKEKKYNGHCLNS